MRTAYHGADIVVHPNCPPPTFDNVTPEGDAEFRRIVAQQALCRVVARQRPDAIAFGDRLLHLTMEFGPEAVHRWLRTSSIVQHVEPLPCEEQGERSA